MSVLILVPNLESLISRKLYMIFIIVLFSSPITNTAFYLIAYLIASIISIRKYSVYKILLKVNDNSY